MSAVDSGGPAFPTSLRNYGPDPIVGFDGESILPGHMTVYGGMTQRAYLAAHAPVVPGDFAPLRKSTVIDLGGGRKQIVGAHEAQADTLVRWRLHYADMMIEALK